MEDPTGAAVLPFPVHRRSTIDETLEGFPGRAKENGLPGRRSARRVTVLFTEIRGWKQMADRGGAAAAGQVLTDTLVFSFHSFYPAYNDVRGQQWAGLVMMGEQILTLGTLAFVLLRPRLQRTRLAHA